MSSALKIKEVETLRKELPSFLAKAKARRSQPAKQVLLSSFIERVFGIKSEDFSEKMEVPVKSKVLLMRGRIDTVFGNLLIEFKVNLDRELEDAKDELKKYFQAMKEKYPDVAYIGMATDDIKFKVYKPVFNEKNEVQKISEIDSLDLEEERGHPDKIFLWFDSYLFISEKVVPTTEDLKKRFGIASPTFAITKDLLEEMLNQTLSDPTVRTKIENWAKYLEIVYGDRLTSNDLFIRHTYLATLAKIIVYLHLYGGRIPSKDEVINILNGNKFSDYGIINFIEEDFFSWILHEDIQMTTKELVAKLLRQLVIYDLDKINEDVFKELYQELVDPEVRHDLGEYYTPDWLAEYAIKNLVVKQPKASVLDPACGSGTFLFISIRLVSKELLLKGEKKTKVLKHILDNIVGVDIHPLAVIISRTNYLLALRELLSARVGPLSIPVFLGDTIRLPEFAVDVYQGMNVYRVRAAQKSVFSIPQSLADRPSLLDNVIGRMYEYAKLYEKGIETKKKVLQSFNKSTKNFELRKNERDVFNRDLMILLGLIDKKANSIWTFILRNIYRPVSLMHRKFDMVVGNPPWLTMRFMKNKEYREYLAKESVKYGLVDSKRTHQLPNMELATLFFLKSVDLYLNKGGHIAFVMPKSVLVSQQHRNFRNFDERGIKPIELSDFEKVSPLFNVPSCTILARKM